jgi:Alkylmercury lyase
LNISKEERENRKAAVLSALQRLRDKFPLQQRIEGAFPETRAAYARVLRHWADHGKSPAFGTNSVPEPLLKELVALDALVIDEYGIGCYPFSARGTGISVRYSDKTVHAMCAVDALAIPRLTQHASRITARCALCGYPLECAIEANGSLVRGDEESIRVIVIRQPSVIGTGACCDSLCPGVKFLCGHCAVPEGRVSLTLPQAAVLGNAFFGFQERLLEEYGSL